MRFIKFLILALIALVVLAAAPVLADDLGRARLSLIEGDVQVLIQDTTDWTDAVVNLPLNEGDRLWVPDDARAELQIEGGVYAREDGSTALDVLTINRDSAQFYVDQGHLYLNNRRGGIQTVQIDTPLLSLRSFDNSILMVDVAGDGVTEVSVLKGYVYAESRAGETRVSAGSTLTVRGENDAEMAPIGAPDEWERWNTDRDRMITAWGESSRYLPDELHEYSSDFDQNGQWDYVSDYGYVWTPTITVAGWAPYTYGRWVWIRGSYVWIDYDHWGWAPCHYGRWVFITSRGWCWVPPAPGAAYWSPGYVGWIVTPSYVAWVPLAPGETYYGYGYYGPGSVNITTVNINTVVVNRTYINARAANAVTVVQRGSFGTGRRVPVRLSENPFLTPPQRREAQQEEHIGPPRVRPRQPVVIVSPEQRDQVRQRPPERERMRREQAGAGRETPVAAPPSPMRRETGRQPAVAPAPQQRPLEQRLPPARVRSLRPEALKNERPLVKQRESSVFRPQQPQNLPVRRSTEPRVINRGPVRAPQQQGAQPQKKQGEERKENRRERGRE